MLLSKSTHSQKRCEKCDIDIDNSVWKGQRIIIKPYPNSPVNYCVRCGLNSTNRRIMLTENNLDEFIQKGNGVLEINQTQDFVNSESKKRKEVVHQRKMVTSYRNQYGKVEVTI